MSNKNKHYPRVVKSNTNLDKLSLALSGILFCSISTMHAMVQAEESPAYTLKIITHGESAPRSSNLTETGRADNRRADVRMTTTVKREQSVQETVEEATQVKTHDAINRMVQLNDGGVVWITQDPSALQPILTVSAANQAVVEAGHLLQPLSFTLNTNYAHFIDRWELKLFADNDPEQRSPIAHFMGRDLMSTQTIKWDGIRQDGDPLHAGDELHYVLKVYDAQGHVDETRLQSLHLGSEQQQRADQFLNNTPAKPQTENQLVRQTIPIQGSRVRIYGRDINRDNPLRINNEPVSVDTENRFVLEKILPEGKHHFDIAVTPKHGETYHKTLSTELVSKYLFMVGIADITVGENKISGNIQSLNADTHHYGGDIFVDGRLAFYLKGKIKGKYLITAQADTETAPIDELFDNFHKKDPQSVFRRLDPDKYYPVYGDDSTITDDTDSQGKLYVRVDWDKSRAIWGNYNTDLSGTELSTFNRSLYGAKLNHRSTKTTALGEHKTDLTVFASEAQTAFRHNRFLGTGGSLYYLKDTDIVEGSEKVWVEVRQANSDRAVETLVLEAGRDYDMDDFQGRIILNRPLLQVAGQAGPSIIKDTPLDGNQVFLMVDYEYVPDSFDADKLSYGGRAKVWGNEHVAVGATFVHEDRQQDDYRLGGVDVTLRRGKGSYLKGEYARSESQQTQGSFLSEDGGLNFSPFTANTAATDSSGAAYSLEARAVLQELNPQIRQDGTVGAWYKHRDAGFSTARLDSDVETIETGVEGQLTLSDKLALSTRLELQDKKTQRKTTSASLQADYQTHERLTVSGELKHIDEQDHTNTANSGKGTLGALKAAYQVNDQLDVYAIGQGTLAKSGGYDANNLFTVGAKARLNDKLNLRGEVSAGDRGESATLGVDYKVSDAYQVYTNYTLAPDSSSGRRGTFTVGQRRTISNQLKVFTEHQFTHEDKQSGLGHTFGLDYALNDFSSLTASLQSAKLDNTTSGTTDRHAFSVGYRFSNDKLKASTTLEYRQDKGTDNGSQVDTQQFVSTNKLTYQVSEALRLQAKLNASKTQDRVGDDKDARFIEAGVGFAYRPVMNDRLNVLGRLTYLEDIKPTSQDSEADERSLIASVETNYQLNPRWQVGGKLAHRKSEIRADKNAASWTDNDATLAAVRVRYHLTHQWDAMAQYQWMNSKASGDTQHGALIALDRHINKNFKVGVGYSFADFSDDLRDDNTGQAEGWFINIVGKY